MSIVIRRLTAADLLRMASLSPRLGEASGDPDTRTGRRPGSDYLGRLLGDHSFIAPAALKDGGVIGGIAACERHEFERERSETDLDDLAVSAARRSQGVATAPIGALRRLAAQRGAQVIFVQADTTGDDGPAIALDSKPGRREEVLHFDIDVGPRCAPHAP
jgi:aminoglycoside 3-N-acetyltransferase I